MRKVFIVQHSEGKNFAPARDFGEIHIILSGKETPDVAFKKLSSVLSNFKITDYLLLVGNPVNIAMAGYIVFDKFAVVNFLVWERDRFAYKHEQVAA